MTTRVTSPTGVEPRHPRTSDEGEGRGTSREDEGRSKEEERPPRPRRDKKVQKTIEPKVKTTINVDGLEKRTSTSYLSRKTKGNFGKD